MRGRNDKPLNDTDLIHPLALVVVFLNVLKGRNFLTMTTVKIVARNFFSENILP